MKFQALILILLLACMYPTLAQGSYENCCLKYIAGLKKNLKRRIDSYRRQETDGGCNIPAVVFSLRLRDNKVKSVCADPKRDWVKKLTTDIDRRQAKV
ncbi:C-C motif chemokine 25b [Chanos chanos]|uniref:C-C motif chemokine 25b n=1 Tax=Chanos chanos TaxID=29144 RepID=A0A6J2WAK8_CHACN|nr:C-C motif chemokine 25-like [Chanos chanos]